MKNSATVGLFFARSIETESPATPGGQRPSILRWREWRRGIALLTLLLSGAQALSQAQEDRNDIDFTLGETLSYDNNLYRLPSGVSDLDSAIGPGARREDYISKTSLGASAHWLLGRQSFDLGARADDNRFRYNDDLNHVAGNGRAVWNWVLGHAWSGRVGAVYDRSLAAFANNRYLGKDMLTSTDYFAEARAQLTPRWSATGALHGSRAEHSADARDVENLRSTTASAGLTYETPRLNAYGVSYRYTDAHFPDASSTDDRDYTETAPKVWLKYRFSAKTDVDVQLGYLHRNYPDTGIGDFSGEFWRGTLNWMPTVKTQLALSGWHELQAYLEAGSDYFVSEGFSVTPAWLPTDRWKVMLQYSYDRQRFIGSTATLPGQPRRRDTVRSRSLSVSYAPLRWFDLGLSWRKDDRDSNRELLDYDDDSVSLGVTAKF